MRIAVVGSGVSGLGAAYLLSRAHEVELFERDAPRGRAREHGRARRARARHRLPRPQRRRTTRCSAGSSRELGVATHESEMSFSVSCAGCGLEYSGRRPFAQPRQRGRARASSRSLWEIGRWLRTARRVARAGRLRATARSASYLDERGYSQRFRRHFLVPLTSALWSTAPGRALEFPAAYAIRFFDNHGMLGFGRFRWRTVTGGSRTLRRRDRARGSAAALHARARRPLGPPHADGVELRTDDGDGARVRPRSSSRRTPTRRSRCSRTRPPTSGGCSARSATRANEAVLHTDASLPAAARAARARRGTTALGDDGRPTVTYYLNRLQALEAERDYCVTLNEDGRRRSTCSAASPTTHPLFTRRDARARSASCRCSPARAGRTTRARTSATASTRTASRRGVARRRARSGSTW